MFLLFILFGFNVYGCKDKLNHTKYCPEMILMLSQMVKYPFGNMKSTNGHPFCVFSTFIPLENPNNLIIFAV